MRPILSLVFVIACGSTAPPPPAPDATPAETEPEALARAEAAAKELGGTLKRRVTEAMGEGGPEHAVGVCNTEAALLAQGVIERTEVAVGRASLRLRNPENEGPEWVMAWLKAQGERPAEGVAPVREVVVVDGTQRARVILPIALEAGCVACHGTEAQIPDPVAALVSERYPNDKAVGYAVGDLRGALWAETSLRP